MARTVLKANISSATPYTVPAGKYAIFKAYALQGGAPTTLKVGGIDMAALSYATGSGTSGAGPVTAAAGDILTTTDVGTPVPVGISGFLYDVA